MDQENPKPPEANPDILEGLVVEEILVPQSAPVQDGPDYGLFILLLLVLAGIAASNVWLRKRAERESGQAEEEDSSSAS